MYVTNPSYAVNGIAKSFDLKAGDEVLTTDLEYGACDKTWEYYCKKAGAKYVRQHIPLPIQSKEELVLIGHEDKGLLNISTDGKIARDFSQVNFHMESPSK